MEKILAADNRGDTMHQLTDEKINLISQICHLGWVSYQIATGGEYHVEPSEDDLISHRYAIADYQQNPDLTAESVHNTWMQGKVKAGWIYGYERDNEKKIHPLLKPFNLLPEAEQRKDIMQMEVLKAAVKLVTGE